MEETLYAAWERPIQYIRKKLVIWYKNKLLYCLMMHCLMMHMMNIRMSDAEISELLYNLQELPG